MEDEDEKFQDIRKLVDIMLSSRAEWPFIDKLLHLLEIQLLLKTLEKLDKLLKVEEAT